MSRSNPGRCWPLIIMPTARRWPLPSVLYLPPLVKDARLLRQAIDRQLRTYEGSSVIRNASPALDSCKGSPPITIYSLILHPTILPSNIESTYSRTRLTVLSKLSTRLAHIRLCHMAHERRPRCCSLSTSPWMPFRRV